MKALTILRASLLVVILAGCATLPEPSTPEEALAVGRLVLSFPDGFLGGPAQDIRHGIKIVLRNRSTGKSQVAFTSEGFYRFILDEEGPVSSRVFRRG